MMHKAWCCIEAVPYYFSRSSIKFQGHAGWRIYDLNPIWVRLLDRSQLLKSLRFALSSLYWQAGIFILIRPLFVGNAFGLNVYFLHYEKKTFKTHAIAHISTVCTRSDDHPCDKGVVDLNALRIPLKTIFLNTKVCARNGGMWSMINQFVCQIMGVMLIYLHPTVWSHTHGTLYLWQDEPTNFYRLSVPARRYIYQ